MVIFQFSKNPKVNMASQMNRTPCNTMPIGFNFLGSVRWLNRANVFHSRSFCDCIPAGGFSQKVFMPSDAYVIGTVEFPNQLSPELEAEIAAEIGE